MYVTFKQILKVNVKFTNKPTIDVKQEKNQQFQKDALKKKWQALQKELSSEKGIWSVAKKNAVYKFSKISSDMNLRSFIKIVDQDPNLYKSCDEYNRDFLEQVEQQKMPAQEKNFESYSNTSNESNDFLDQQYNKIPSLSENQNNNNKKNDNNFKEVNKLPVIIERQNSEMISPNIKSFNIYQETDQKQFVQIQQNKDKTEGYQNEFYNENQIENVMSSHTFRSNKIKYKNVEEKLEKKKKKLQMVYQRLVEENQNNVIKSRYILKERGFSKEEIDKYFDFENTSLELLLKKKQNRKNIIQNNQVFISQLHKLGDSKYFNFDDVQQDSRKYSGCSLFQSQGMFSEIQDSHISRINIQNNDQKFRNQKSINLRQSRILFQQSQVLINKGYEKQEEDNTYMVHQNEINKAIGQIMEYQTSYNQDIETFNQTKQIMTKVKKQEVQIKKQKSKQQEIKSEDQQNKKQQKNTQTIFPAEYITLSEAFFGTFSFENDHLVYISNGKIRDKNEQINFAFGVQNIKTKKKKKHFFFNQIKSVQARRFNFQEIAIEIFTTSGKTYFFNFNTEETRKQIFSLFTKYSEKYNVELIEDRKLSLENKKITQKWVNGEITNFEYLMHLNSYSGRTFNDTAQYYIFPWILSNYKDSEIDLQKPNNYRDLSLPMGAINEKKYKEAESKMLDRGEGLSGEPQHLYGSHYSTAGHICHYLIRLEPFTQLHIELTNSRIFLSS
ncbi:BEACH domain [Pseudocohnilembus persalinus]|uniref:BEACH domain n=1 Tax=Pseudocohnilembus persalinus TaxID=266149 RepID=A0A0V0QEX6_PSEPJ|nr:BEACH domain [Pseudocohnilembus persalinus]|eukprot:KRX00699.1 BEACH domain [Pseudocohnilembus persalinus]